MGILGSLLSAGTSLIGGAIQAKASKKEAELAAQTAANKIQYAQDATAQITALQQPYLNAGGQALNPLLSQFGLSGGGSAPVSSNPLSATPAAPAGQAYDWQAYGAANPDVLAAASDPNSGLNGSTVEQRLADHYARYGAAEAASGGRTAAPTVAAAAEPKFQVDPNTGAVTAERPTAGARPDAVRPDTPEFSYAARPTVDPYSFDYTASPGLQFQQDEARRATLASASKTGSLQSGAAAKALQDRAQGLAYQDFTKERAFDYGVYSDAANRSDANYNTDRGFSYNQNQNILARSDNNFATDRTFNNNNYETDRAYGDNIFNIDRGYATDRYDQRTSDLFGLTSVGTGAASATGAAATGFANAAMGATGTAGAAAGANAINQGNILTSALGSAAGSLYQGYQGQALSRAATGAIKSNPLLF